MLSEMAKSLNLMIILEAGRQYLPWLLIPAALHSQYDAYAGTYPQAGAFLVHKFHPVTAGRVPV